MDTQKQYKCYQCGLDIQPHKPRKLSDGNFYHLSCWDELSTSVDNIVDKPKHYHKYGMDTLTFLKEGFPPEVVKNFCIGNIIKYTQRYQLKNGIEDLKKAQFYMNYLLELEKPSE